MKKTLIALMALAGVAMADTLTMELTALNSPGTLIGGDSSNALVTSAVFDNTTDYATLTDLFTETGKWYAHKGYNNNINTTTGNGVPSSNKGAVLVAGGPVANGRSTIGGIEFSLTSAELAQFGGAITLSFDIAHHYGNDNKNHEFTFHLLGENFSLASEVYNSKSGDNLLVEGLTGPSPALTVALTLSADIVAALQATGTDQTFAFVAYSDAVNGSNTGVLMNNFKLSGEGAVPEPTTATLSLLALAGLVARRRRK